MFNRICRKAILFEGMNAAAPYMMYYASKIMSGNTSSTIEKVADPAASEVN